MLYMRKLILLSFGLCTFLFGPVGLTQERFTIRESIQIANTQTGAYFMVSPNDGYTYRVIGTRGNNAKLEIFDAEGNSKGTYYSTWNNNIKNNMIAVPVQEAVSVLDDAETFGDPPSCDDNSVVDHLDDGGEIAEDEVDPESTVVTEKEECQVEGTTPSWQQNCEKLYDKGIPEGALNFALDVMKKNSSSFKSNKCYKKNGLKQSGHASMMGMNAEKIESSLMADGFKNKCQMVINDTDNKIKGYPCRATMYYIDLCQGDEPVVSKDYFNLGSGTCSKGRGFKNQSNQHTTVLGAFFTHTKTFDFTDTTKQQDKYRKVAKDIEKMGGPREATAVHLFGMQNTNNLASKNGKYMHVSPHKSSWGCPSVNKENYWMIKTLAENGPSLVVNYAEGKMEDIDKCSEE